MHWFDSLLTPFINLAFPRLSPAAMDRQLHIGEDKTAASVMYKLVEVKLLYMPLKEECGVLSHIFCEKKA